MSKRRIVIYIILPILLISGGWDVFSRYIRPNHYQLLFPYSIFQFRNLSTTQTRLGRDGRLQIMIPAGNASLGKNDYFEEIFADGYWIDQIPVTVKDYKEYLKLNPSLPPRYHDEYYRYWEKRQFELLPVVFVSWGQAEEYCEFFGGHLPTEIQWEKAARGTMGNILYWDDSIKAFNKANYDNFYNGKTPSGWLPAGKTVYGVLDMSGNVREWAMDWLLEENQRLNQDAWISQREIIEENLGRILKGGSYADDVSHLRLNSRDAHDPNSPGLNRGFRCVYER